MEGNDGVGFIPEPLVRPEEAAAGNPSLHVVKRGDGDNATEELVNATDHVHAKATTTGEDCMAPAECGGPHSSCGSFGESRHASAETQTSASEAIPEQETAIRRKAPRLAASEKNCNVYVAQLPDNFGDAELHRLASHFGKVISARVMRMRHHAAAKRYAFVLFATESAAATCVQTLHHMQLDEKHVLECRLAHDNASDHLRLGPSKRKAIEEFRLKGDAAEPPRDSPKVTLPFRTPPNALVQNLPHHHAQHHMHGWAPVAAPATQVVPVSGRSHDQVQAAVPSAHSLPQYSPHMHHGPPIAQSQVVYIASGSNFHQPPMQLVAAPCFHPTAAPLQYWPAPLPPAQIISGPPFFHPAAVIYNIVAAPEAGASAVATPPPAPASSGAETGPSLK